MSQKFIKKKQTSPKSLGYGKYYAKAVYNQKHITTRQLADFIQQQASVKRSDCIAVLDELGYALRHFIGLGEKVKIDNVGIFKCGLRNQRGGFEDAKDLRGREGPDRINAEPSHPVPARVYHLDAEWCDPRCCGHAGRYHLRGSDGL